MKIFSLLLIFLSLSLYAQLPGPIESPWSEKNVPILHPFEERYLNNPVYDFFVDDFDRDGHPEIAELRAHADHPVMLSVRDLASTNYAMPMYQVPYYDGYAEDILQPLAGHPLYKALIYCRRKDHGEVLLFDHNMQPVDSLETLRGKDNTGTGEWVGRLTYPYILDLNGDQRPDLVFLINTAGDGQPRALLGYDLLTKKKILDRRFAPMVEGLKPVDFYNDGHPKLMLTLGGAGDGPFFGEFLRDESYLVLLELDGTVIKSWPHPGKMTYVQYTTADVTKDQCLDIIATFYSLDENSGLASSLKVIDGRSLEIRDFYTSPTSTSELNGVFIMRADTAGIKILTTSENGIFNLFRYNTADSSLVRERIVHISQPQLGYFLIKDVNGDGTDEIIFLSLGNARIFILDASLSPLAIIPMANFKAPFRMQLIKRNASLDPEMLFLSNNSLFRVQLPLHKLFPPPPVRIRYRGEIYSLNRVPVLIGLLLFLLPGVFAVSFLLKRNAAMRAAWSNSSRVAAMIVQSSERIVWVNAAFLQAFGFTKSPAKMRIDDLLDENTLRPLKSVWDTFKQTDGVFLHREVPFEMRGNRHAYAVEISRLAGGYAQILLVDISETTQTQRLKMWATLAQRLVHKTKTPLASVMLSAQRMQRYAAKTNSEFGETIHPFVHTILGELDKVRHDINDFLRFSRLEESSLKITDLCTLINEIADTFRKRLPDAVRLHQETPGESIFASIDAKQLHEAVAAFLENALSATQGSGNLLLTLHLAQHPLGLRSEHRAVIEIVDDGVGINEDDLEKIFQPGFSTFRGGSGMGMMIAKMIIEQNGGELDIKSRENIGTTVTIILPVVNQEV